MKRFLPIRIFSIKLGYGWWWGGHFYFFKLAFAIIPMWLHMNDCTYYHGKGIERGDVKSWSKNRQREKDEDERIARERKENQT